MAEALAVIGLVSTIIQFVEFGNTVVGRLNDFRQSIHEVPKTFRKISDQLPLLIDTLRRTQIQADAGHVGEETSKALKPVVEGCLAQVKQLEDILVKALPSEKDSPWSRSIKALASLANDKTIQQITSELESYVRVLTYHQATSSSTLSNQLVILGVSQPLKPNAGAQREPCFSVKFAQEKHFIGREDVMEEIDRRLMMGQHRVAIAGIGGVGKSQIAIEYCYRYRRGHPEANIFWVHASNHARFTEAYHEIARELAIPDTDNPDIDTIQLVLRWLNNDANGPWLLVLDNADDMEIFFGSSRHRSSGQDEQQPKSLVSYLPQSVNGLMLITTRDRRIGERLSGREKPIAVVPFEIKDAKRLLQSTLREDNLKDEECTALLEALDFLPLAITQAAAFIRENDISLADYLELLRASDEDMKDLLAENHHDPARDMEIRNSVFQTWKLSFDSIKRQKPRAAEILSLMAALDRQAIQDILLRRGDERKIDFTTAIGTLKAFSLITEEREGATFEMHRLVQLSTQRWLESEGVIEEWQEKALTAVSKCCPFDGRYENWTAWEAINPHVQVVLRFVFNTDLCMLERASILGRVALYDLEQGRHEAAYKKTLEALVIHEELLDKDHADTLMTVSNLAMVLERQGKYDEAEKIYRRVLEIEERVRGKEHPNTITIISNLAEALHSQGKYNEAEKIHRQVVEVEERVLGEEHPNTLTAIGNLAAVLHSQGKYSEAEKMHRRALGVEEKVLGEEHPSTLTSMANLATVLHSQGKDNEAEQIHRQVLELREIVLGLEHPNTLSSMGNLAAVLRSQGKDIEAEQIHRQVLGLRQTVLGFEHPNTLASMNNFAAALHSQGKYSEAEQTHRQVLKLTERVMGLEHPNTLSSMNNLAEVLRSQGKYSEAEKMHLRVIELDERVLGEEHPDTLASMGNLAAVLHNQGKYSEAEKMHRRVLEVEQRVLRKEHPDILESMSDLAAVLHSQGKYSEAEEIHRRVLEVDGRVLGKDHPNTLASVNSLAKVLRSLGRYEEAEEMIRRALDGREKMLGLEHPDTLASVNSLAMVLERQGRYEEAEETSRRALDGREKVLGFEHPDTITSAYGLARLLQSQKQYVDASTLYQRAYSGYQKTLGSDHPTTRACSKDYLSMLEESK